MLCLGGQFADLFKSGQESTALAAMSTLAHHGIIYVPLGYKTTFHLLGDNSEVRGGSPWGAGTFSVSLLFSVFRTQQTDTVIERRRVPPAYTKGAGSRYCPRQGLL